jgi:hypothetical protein
MPLGLRTRISASRLTNYRDAILRVQASGQGDPGRLSRALQAVEARMTQEMELGPDLAPASPLMPASPVAPEEALTQPAVRRRISKHDLPRL